jgi:hypothetical protein
LTDVRVNRMVFHHLGVKEQKNKYIDNENESKRIRTRKKRVRALWVLISGLPGLVHGLDDGGVAGVRPAPHLNHNHPAIHGVTLLHVSRLCLNHSITNSLSPISAIRLNLSASVPDGDYISAARRRCYNVFRRDSVELSALKTVYI